MREYAVALTVLLMASGCGGGSDSAGSETSMDLATTVSPADVDGWNGCYFDGVPMWGSVYVADHSLRADFSVYVADHSLRADLSVYPRDRRRDADSCGMWWFADHSLKADFSVYFTDHSLRADFDIYLTDRWSSAGR